MKTAHWENFGEAALSKVDHFVGGLYPKYTFETMNAETGFAAIQYRLQVNAAQNGWHHFMGMYTSMQGAAFANACVKESVRSGYYQFLLHFDMIKPAYNPAIGPQAQSEFLDDTFRASMFYGEDSNINSGGTFLNGNIMDLMIFRPTLVDPTNANNFQLLWNSNSAVYNGFQMYFTGIPLADPILVNSSVYEL